MDETTYKSSADDGDFLTQIVSSLPTFRRAQASTIDNAARTIAFCTFGISSFLFVTNPNRATLIERPAQTGVFGLAICGVFIVIMHTILRVKFGTKSRTEDSIPLAHPAEQRLETLSQPEMVGRINKKHFSLTLLAVVLTLRVHLYQQIVRNYQCASPGIEGVLPFLIATWEGIGRTRSGGSDQSHGIVRPVFSSILTSWGNVLAAMMSSSPRSTAICPAHAGKPAWTVIYQVVGVICDAYLLRALRESLQSMRSERPTKLRNAPLFLGLMYLLSSFLILISGLLFAIMPHYRLLLTHLDADFPMHILWASFLFTLISLSAIRILTYGTSLDIVILASMVASALSISSSIPNLDNSLAPNLYFPMIPPLLLIFVGVGTHFGGAHMYKSQGRPLRNLLFMAMFTVMAVVIFWQLFRSHEPQRWATHPIDQLIYEARMKHSHYVDQASHSKTLDQAVQEYQSRYGRHPPPGFDKWYIYATERKSVIIDDYDMIEENLRPFWKIQPQQIRMRTKLLLSDEANDCAEVSIRSGNASIGIVRGTHRWMVDGIINMMKDFATALPDMDIAFNINDEPRVAVPWDNMEAIKQAPSVPEKADTLQDGWSVDRAAGWVLNSPETMSSLGMEMRSFRKIFRDYGSIACPPNSPARTQHLWDVTTVCTTCYTPHSYGPFLHNWTLAESPCHQPDLALLHGFHLGPSAFMGTHELVPIFSQSRAGGFADILYPSAWNYNDKVKYDPSTEHPDLSFKEKENTLFWRGGTTEGFSERGEWKASTRQRLINAANNSTLEAPVLLPTTNGWGFQLASKDTLWQHPSLKDSGYSNSLAFVGKYPRCDLGDCEAQKAHFGSAESSDFQHHWKHRFLLDADGAGFSGRFLSFLQSHSLPVKTAIFREWYDERVFPWKHFVPVDVRLHGIWSTMAYFAGGFGTSTLGRDPGEEIAEAGREWAGKVLRKEDMEIYFYRLLLEYGRITDDRRDELGFKGKA